jgi:hypothetical protein
MVCLGRKDTLACPIHLQRLSVVHIDQFDTAT